MLNPVLRQRLRSILRAVYGIKKTKRREPGGRLWLEELETRLAPTTGLSADNQQLLQAYGRLPLSFEANAGQATSQVQYLSRGSGYALFLTPTSAVLSLQTPTAPPTPGSPGA